MAFKGRDECLAERGVHARIISEKEREGRDLRRAVGNRVVLEFGRDEEFRPLVRIICTKDTKISFNFLIGSFSLSVGLGMVCK